MPRFALREFKLGAAGRECRSQRCVMALEIDPNSNLGASPTVGAVGIQKGAIGQCLAREPRQKRCGPW